MDFNDGIKKKIIYVVIGVLVGLLAMWVIFKAATPAVRKVCGYVLEVTGEEGQAGQDRRVDIEAMVIEPGRVTRRINTIGRLKANKSVTIKSEIHGKVESIMFEEGSQVKQGDLLITFVRKDLEAEIEEAKSQVTVGEADFARIEKLYATNASSTKQLDEARAKVEMAKARLASAEAKFAKAEIYAPFSGTIGLIDVSEGAYVQAGADLVKLVDLTPIRLDFTVPEKHIHDIGIGQVAEVRFDGLEKEIFTATVDAIDSAVESQSHSIKVRASINNEEELLKPGMSAGVSLIIGEKSDAIMVPEVAVDREGKLEYVWAIEKGRAMYRPVLTGTREKGNVEILAGLTPGMIIVTVGQLKLYPGVAVKITNMTEEQYAKILKQQSAPKKATPSSAKKEEKKTEPVKAAESGDEPKKEAPKAEPAKDESKVKEELKAEPKKEEPKEEPKAEVKIEPKAEVKPEVQEEPGAPKVEPKSAEKSVEPVKEELKKAEPKKVESEQPTAEAKA